MGKAQDRLVKGKNKNVKKKKATPKVQSSMYTTRNRAIKRLQISMPDFRRLCILKGVHPRVPNKKVMKQGGKQSNYYLTKDISHLYYDPLLDTLRNLKVFQKKVKKAAARLDFEKVAQLNKHKPEYSLNHIIKERYPTFQAALRELGDALHVLSLISTLPVSSQVSLQDVSTSSLLVKQFLALIVHQRLLDRVFFSVKGIYYQVTVQGQPIVWLTPYEFPQSIPKSVDIQLIMNYCEFYQVLLSFVNFRLYTTNGLRYPPPLKEITNPNYVSQISFDGRTRHARHHRLLKDLSKTEDQDNKDADDENPKRTEEELMLERQRVMFLSAIILEKASNNSTSSTTIEIKSVAPQNQNQKQIQHSKKLMESLPTKLVSIAQNEQQREEEEEEEGNNTEDGQNGENAVTTLSKVDEIDADDELMKEMEKIEMNSHRLFEGFHFYLSREVPKNAFEFIICSYGGKVTWDNENDPSITHHIIDRPLTSQSPSFLSRIYVQPQWIADSVNAKFLLPIEEYLPGKSLPPHLSPFLATSMLQIEGNENKEGEDETVEQYIPQRQLEINDMIRGVKSQTQPQSEEQHELDDEEEDVEEQELNYLKELSKEQGFDLPQERKNNKKRNRSGSKKRNTIQQTEFEEKQKESLERLQKITKLEARERKREREELELRKEMLPRKKRALYNKLSKQEQRRKDWVDNLKTKKALIDERNKTSQ